MAARVEISKSKSKKKPFKVSVIGENGEMLMASQLFTTRLNCMKNILAVMNAFNSPSVKVVEFSKSGIKKFTLHFTGFEEYDPAA